MNKSQKCSTSQVGRVVIHKEDEEKRVYEYELQEYLNDGWLKGISDIHRQQLSEKHLGQIPFNKGKKMSQETYEKVKASGTWFGNRPAWNKGLTKETDERVLKYSKPLPEETKKRMSLERMGHYVSEETKAKISNKAKRRKLSPEKLKEKLNKEYSTRKKNNTFNSSKPEKDMLENLKIEYSGKTILTHYKEKRYPYYCDFYIVEDDLFIELNAHWTHGGRPYNPEDSFCKNQLAEWKEKAKQSQFYANAINTWTIRDVEKLQCAINNKLNYRTIY